MGFSIGASHFDAVSTAAGAVNAATSPVSTPANDAAILRRAAECVAAARELLKSADEYGLRASICKAGALLVKRAIDLLSDMSVDPHMNITFALDAAEDVFRFGAGAGKDKNDDSQDFGISYALADVMARQLAKTEKLILKQAEAAHV